MWISQLSAKILEALLSTVKYWIVDYSIKESELIRWFKVKLLPELCPLLKFVLIRKIMLC